MNQEFSHSKQLWNKFLFSNAEVHHQANQVLLVSDNFYLFAGLGPIIDGNIIITTHECKHGGLTLTCIRYPLRELIDELLYLKGMIQ